MIQTCATKPETAAPPSGARGAHGLPAGYVLDDESARGRRTWLHASRSCGDGANSQRWQLHVGEGITVSASEVSHDYDCSETMVSQSDVLKVHVRLQGESVVKVADEAAVRVPAMSFSALLQPLGSDKTEWIGGAAQRSVTIACTADYARDELGLDRVDWTEPMAGFLAGRQAAPSCLDAPLLGEIRIAGETLITDICGGPASR